MLLARAGPLDTASALEQSYADADARSYLALTKVSTRGSVRASPRIPARAHGPLPMHVGRVFGRAQRPVPSCMRCRAPSSQALADFPEDVAAAALHQTDRRRAAGKQVVGTASARSMQDPLPAEDPLDWLDELGVRLEEELDTRQVEAAGGGGDRQAPVSRGAGGGQPPAAGGADASAGQAGFDPDQLARRMRQFVAAGAGLEGAEVPEGAGPPGGGGTLPTLDARGFLDELRAALGGDAGAGMTAWSSDDDEGSSFYDGTSSDDGGDGRPGSGATRPPRPPAAAEPVDTETDSDDEGFDEAYGEVLRQQLAAGTGRGQGTSATPGDSGVDVARGIAGAADRRPRDAGPLTAPDLDMNLVQSLLQSVESQGGGPGPGSNLAALLGVPLPGGDGPGQRGTG